MILTVNAMFNLLFSFLRSDLFTGLRRMGQYYLSRVVFGLYTFKVGDHIRFEYAAVEEAAWGYVRRRGGGARPYMRPQRKTAPRGDRPAGTPRPDRRKKKQNYDYKNIIL